MKQPKFQVGEIVIIQSLCHPEFNGTEATVERSYVSMLWRHPTEGKVEGGWAYDLNVKAPTGPGGWAEIALRKKHQPGEMSFHDLMQNLKQPQTEWA